MTDEEVGRIKAETIDALAAVRGRRACLKAKAEMIRAEAEAARVVLAKVLKGEKPDSTPSRERWPSYDDVVATWEGIREADIRIRELEQRLRDWGAID